MGNLRRRVFDRITELTNASETKAVGPSELQHVQFLDAIRGLAILMVVAVHTLLDYQDATQARAVPSELWNLFYSGQYGVQLFFVASAITLAYSHDKRGQEPHPYLRFFARRWFRIAPLYWFGIAIYAFAWAHGHHFTPDIVVLNALFLHPYSHTAFVSIPPGGWSIGVEMQFYVLLPLLLIVARNVRSAVYVLVAALIVCLGTFTALNALGKPTGDQSFTYFWLPNQIPVFAAGLLCYQLMKDQFGKGGAAPSVPGVATILAIAGLLVAGWCRPASPLYHLVFVAIFAVLVLSVGRSPWSGIVNRPMVTLGKLSYSIYILHFAVLTQLFKLFAKLHTDLPAAVALPILWICGVALTALLATLTYKFIEQPGIAAGRQVIRRFAKP